MSDPFPLAGVRVLDLTMVYAGPLATWLLAALGAEVIRVESGVRSGRGGLRPVGTFPQGDPGERPYNRLAFYNELNRNKKAITLNLQTPQGRELFLRLAGISDVVIENYSPRVMEQFGLAPSVLFEANSRLIVVSMPAYGLSGPSRDYVAFGTGIEAMAGLVALTGYRDGPPLKPGVAFSDAVSGLYAAYAVLGALHQRSQGGRGLHIELAQREALLSLMGEPLAEWSLSHREPQPWGNADPYAAPQGCYPCRGEERWIALSVRTPQQWEKLCTALGRPLWTEDDRFATLVGRLRHRDELDQLIADRTRHEEASVLAAHLQTLGVPAAPVLRPDDLFHDPHLRDQGFFQRVSHPEAGTHDYPGLPWRLSRARMVPPQPAPCFAQHNREILEELLGLSDQELTALEEEGVISWNPSEGIQPPSRHSGR